MLPELSSKVNLGRSLKRVPRYFSRPVAIFKSYDRANLRADIFAGITVGFILLPQAIAFSLIAELKPEMGIYAAIIAGIVGALWGSSNQAHTGPTNATSLLVLSILLANFSPGSAEFLAAAGMLAVLSGVFQLMMGLARLGMLVNFVSHSVIVGFAAGAGVLIAIRQIPPLLGLHIEGHTLSQAIPDMIRAAPEVIPAAALLGLGSILLLIVLPRINKKIPAAILTMIVATALVYFLNLTDRGVEVIGQLPKQLPPLADLPLLDLNFISRLSTGALAVGAIGLVETAAISRSISAQTSQRLDNNQEFVGQGLANIVTGLFSGYPSAASFSRSAVNFNSGARSPFAAVFSSVFVLIALFATASMAAYLPRAALAGVLIVVGIGMINRKEIARIWGGTRGDAIIMVVTLFGTLFLEITFAILVGIMLSFARYILRTSMPRVQQIVPDHQFRHLTFQPEKPTCPQLSVIDIQGDLYFGAVNHVEEIILDHLEKESEQRFLLIRMENVNVCDYSGINMLEHLVQTYRDRGGDVFMMQVNYRIDQLMASTDFSKNLGQTNFLDEDEAISNIFYRHLDPAVCIYECPYKVFAECQNLPKQLYLDDVSLVDDDHRLADANLIEPERLWEELRIHPERLRIFDVREPREYRRGHIPNAILVPLPQILSGEYKLQAENNHRTIFVCRSGRRSRRAAELVVGPKENVQIVKGGMLAWEAAGLLQAIG